MSIFNLKGKSALSIQTILQITCHRFKDAGIEQPRLEAEVLLAHFLKVDRLVLYTHREDEILASKVEEFFSLVLRRIHREPLAYIIEHKEFWSLDFLVSPSVLIPRPETEFVVEAAISYLSGWKHFFAPSCLSNQIKIVDVGTGSGNIAISLAKELPQAHIYALDFSEKALQVARSNAIRHNVIDRITFLGANLVSCLAPNLAEAIVSNPPYISSKEIFTLIPDIFAFEPHLALDGGTDGLACSQRLIREAKGILKPDGWLIMEMGYNQKDSLAEEMERQGYRIKEVISDYAGIERVMVARKEGK